MADIGTATSIAEINAADDSRAAALILPFIERAPEVAAIAAASRPFEGPGALAAALARAIRGLDPEARLRLLRAHPELAPPAPQEMTPESLREQGRFGLDAPDDETRARLAELNAAYLRRFRFPFIIALHEHEDLRSVVEAFEARLAASPDVEIERALGEIASVSRARVYEAFEARAAGAA